MEDKLLGLYNDFKAAGLFTNTKDYNTFRKRMQGQGYQSQIYKVAKQNGADVGQFWQFQRNFGLGRWSGNTNQPAQTSKPLTTSQMAKQIGEQYKKTIQQRSAAYNTGANFAKSQKENQENPIGELASEAWEGVKNIGRSVGNYLGNIGQGMQTTTGGAAPARPYAQPSEYHPKPSKETQQIVKKWGTLTKKDSELSPSERIQANNIRSRIQNAQQQEYNQKNTNPISESRITPNAKNENEVALNLSTDAARQARIKQQHEDDLNQMAYQGVGQNLGKDIFDMTDKAISMAEQASKDFFKGAEDATSFWNQYNPILQKKIADEADRRKSTEFIQQGLQIGLANKVQDYFSRPEIQKYVVDMADKMNISVEDAVQRYFMPNLMRYGQEAVSQRQLEKVLPQGFWDYLGKNLSNSISGMIVSNAIYSKEERQRRQQALAISEGIEEMPQMVGHNSGYYKAGLGSRFVGSMVNMAADSPFFGAGGTAADFSVNTGTRLLTRGLERVGLVKLGARLTPKELAFKAANMSTEQKIMSGLFTNTAKSSLNLGGYSGLTGALQQISTGDDSSAAAVAAAAIEGGWHGMKTGAMFGLSGSITHPWASRYGITGLETSQRQRMLHGAQKLGAHAASLGVEAGTMMVADHLQDGKEMSVAQWLEDGVMVMSFKLGEPKVYKHIGSTLHGLVHNTNNTPITLTKDERNELVNSVSGKNLMDAFVSVNAKEKSIRDKNGNLTLDKHIAESLYKDFMADPEVSRSTKEKVNAALGMPSQNYKISQRSVNDVKNKQVLEYANDGTLLTRTSYKNAEERRDILYRQKVGRENMNIFNLVGIAKMRGVQMTDENGNVKDITIDFLKSHGYDITKDATDPKNAKLVADIKNVNNPLCTEWVMFSNKHADELYGLTDEIKGILKKDPLKRTDEEIKVLKDYSTKLESMLYPENEPHGEQSFVQGRNVVQDNNLGTEQPNGEAVKAELNGLKQAENEMDVLIRDNDVFEQNFQKLKQQGLTNPQIYDWMVQQGGLTVEQLEPFAHYINANARVQGMQEATKNAIDEQVSSYVQDWSFHGTLDGQEMNGEQAIFVQDRDGRMLILGSGEIAFDSTTGRAKEGVGDMIVCLDPNTNEMVYLKTDDVTLSQTHDAENFANEYRQKLQMINSQPYNEAAQEQAMIDAAKPQQENGKTTGTTSMEGDAKSTENNSTEQVNPELYKVANSLQGKVGQSLAKEEADNLVSEMENRAEPARELELTPENWTAEFGEDGKVTTPLGEVKMGENQYFKLAKEGRNGKLGLIKPTLENPDVIIEDASQAKEGQVTERHSSYLFVKAFAGKDGNRVYYFTSVTVSRDGKEVVVSNQERRAKRIATVMESGKILYLKGNQSASVTQNEKPVSLGDSNSSTTTGSQGALHGINSPDLYGKDTDNSSNGNGSEVTLTFENGEKVPVDANGEPDFLKMTPEHGAEVYKMLFEEDAEKQIGSDIYTLQKDLEKVQNAKYEGASVMERAEARKKAKEAIAIAEAQVEKAKAIKKAMTAKKVAESVSKPAESAEGANEASSTVAKKFQNAPRMQGNSVSKRLPDGTKLKGHYEIVPAESLTPSHDAMNGYKKTEGFPVDENGRTVNDRDYENDKAAQQVTDQMAQNYSGQAITQVPTVSDEGIVYDGNGRTMAGQKAAKNGTDAEYIEDLLDNAQNYGFTREQIEQSGIEHPRLVMVTDERLPYDTATFSKFNRNEKKTQSNTEQAVAKAKSLTSDEVGAIVAEIEGNGTLDAFFNNSKAINDLVKTLVDKGIIGQNEVSGMMDSPERLSAQGREYVKNLLLGSIFKPETIRMLGIEPTLKNKAINAIRSVMDNMKLGDFSLRDEIDQAIQLLYEARRGGNKVDTLLRTPDMFGEDAAKRYPSISQMMALALEGKVSDFRDLLDEYNRIAASRNTGEGNVFGDAPTKEELVNEFLNFKKWQDYDTRHSENEGGNDVSGTEKPQQEASGGNESAGEGTEPERPRVEEPDDLVNKELESRIKVTDEETETPSENGPITRQKILIDGDKEVTKVDEPNEKGEYTGSYYEYDGKKFGDLNEVAEYIDGKAKDGTHSKAFDKAVKANSSDPVLSDAKRIASKIFSFGEEGEEGVQILAKYVKLPYARKVRNQAITYLRRKDLAYQRAENAIKEGVVLPGKEEAYRKLIDAIVREDYGDIKNTKPSADPIEGIEKAAEAFRKEQKQKGEFVMNLKLGKARQDYAEAKKSGDESEIKRTRDELKQRLDEHYKAQHMGLVQRRKEIAKEIGMTEAKKIDKPFSEMDSEEREYVANQNPLTESEIREQTSEENKNFIEDAVDYINGNHGFAQKMAYLKIYDDVRNRHENVSDNSGAENGTQLDAANTTGGEKLGLGRGRESGGSDGPVDRGTGNEAAPGEPESREGNQNNPTLSVGKQGDKQGEGNSSDMGAVPSGNTDTKGGSSTGKDGNAPEQGGRGSSNRPAKPDAKRKPAAKQGTTWRGRTGEEIKKNVADKKSAALAAIAELKKRKFGKGGSGHLGSFELLTPEQMEYVPTVMNAVKEYGMAIIDEGIYKVKDWFNHIRETFAGGLKDCGFTDQDIDDFIKEMWNSKMSMDGETHTIAEWCSIYGNQKLREKLGEELDVKYQKQMDAESIEVKIGDHKNIEETLPFLLPQQQDDVLKAETQFFGEEHTDSEHAYGKGYLFTNGTGTGKTYTGLGIAKRLAKQGKGRILFITPSQKKVSDWIKDGRNLNMDIRDLDSVAKEKGTTATTESGDGMVITTYANFRQNKKLLETEWDAVIYDECHRIMENKKGTETTGSNQHYMVTNRNENFCFLRLQSINPEYQKMNDAAEKFSGVREKEIMRIQKEYRESHPSATTKDVINATHNDLPRELINFAPADGVRFPKLGKVYQEFVKARDAYNKVEPKLKEQAKNGWKNTKTVFLSATPFNTRENLDYVEGYIFKYPETDERGMSGRTQFYLNHFGAAYKYRYHRLEQTISNPDAVAKQEVAFSDYLQNTLGTMSGRIIDSAYDYSRDFPTVAPDHAKEFNDAVQSILKAKYLYGAYSKTIGDYNYGSALFETMKVSAAIDRIKQHLDMGRKVVIFHRRVESKEPLEAPFAYMLSVANEQIKLMKPGKDRDEYIKECSEFREKYADLLDWEQTLDYSMPREQIAKVFGKDNVLFFSGKESKKVKDKAVDTFNDDNSGKNIIVIQEASGKEGISLHDVTGNHQRVLITLGLPQSPITALQIEGRTYRIGNKSNAIFEYPILGLNSEMMLFGEKFNNQVSTTENLALGSQARNLRDSFANGILEHSGVIPVENQGVGGKEFDAPKQNDSDPFDDAVLDYYSNQKLNKNNRAGTDYFPTPEPLGYKMVEWAGMGEGDSVLEPSAGHGAIARYVPKSNEMVSIEPSQSLFTKLQLKAGGLGRKFLNNTFENYALSNKHDVIVMNPPFGKAGTLAIQHVDKAFKHLDEGGRIVAIIPRGITDRKFDKWYGEQKNIAMRAEINLPNIVFQQAGTNVSCRVVVLDKITDAALRSKAGYPEKIDLSGHYDKIEDFFNDLRDIEIPDRIIDTQMKSMKKARTFKKDIEEIKGMTVTLEKHGISVFDKNTYRDYSITFPSIKHNEEWTKGNYSKVYERFDQEQSRVYSENSKAALDEMKKLACKLAGMTEDEMQRYIASKNNGDTHFREDRGLQYSKTDAKDVKNSRIIPEDVDKNVSSQIEKRFDNEVNSAKKELGVTDGSFDKLIENKVRLYADLPESEIIKDLEYASNKTSKSGVLGQENPKLHNERSRRAEHQAARIAAKRELDYRKARKSVLGNDYGLRQGDVLSPIQIEKCFKTILAKQGESEEIERLFNKAIDICKRIGLRFNVLGESKNGSLGYSTTDREVGFNIDDLSKTRISSKELPVTILHEILHQITLGSIDLVKRGKADGILTPKQIEAVNSILDIYNKVKDNRKQFKENTYGLTDEYEFAAQMADPRQRKALDLDIWDRIKNAAKELANKGDRSLWQTFKDAIKRLFEISDKDKMDEALNTIMGDFNETLDDIALNDIEENGFAYKITDKDELDRLDKEKTFRMYSGMQEVDGKLYSPMAAIIDGKRTDATEIGAWMGADERPDLVKNGKFTLVKTDKNKGVGEGDVPAAYNPYMHTSTSMMNDQFTGAYARGNIKVVEWEIPESEKTSGYHAEGAKDAVGLVPWHSGSVNSLLPKDRQRQVMLSRWRKAVRVVPDSEVAENIAEQLKGTGLAIPWNVVTPNQVRELAKLGVPITTIESGRQAPETKEKFLQQMADLEQEFPQAKFVNVKMTKDAFKVWGKDGGTKFRTDNSESSYPTSSVENHVEKVAQKTGAKVNMVSSVDEITNKAAKAAIEEDRKITGWYDEKTGEVHLYMPNIHDRYTAEKTIWHEVVGHKGMRELFGEDRFEKFLRDVWYDLDKPENEALKKLVDEERKFNPMNIYDAIEEGIARLAEDGKGEAGFWNGIKNKVSDFLHEIGYRIAPNTKDVKYLLWLSKNLQKNPNDPYWKLRAEAVKYRLDHERMPAVVAHDGMFYGNDGKVRSMESLTKSEWDEATDGQIHFHTTPTAATALDRYHRSLDAHGYMATESYMDNMLSLKKLMNAIVPDKKIEDIASSENPYILQNVMQGAMSDAAKLFEINIMKPLEKSMAGILDAFDGKNSDEKIRNFNLYMITKHGLERNREFFVRDFLKQMRMDEQKKQDADFLENSYYSDKEYLDNELKAGNIDLKEYYRQLDESIRNHFDADFEAGEHDYSGMHAIQEVAKSSDPYDDAEAIQSVMDSEAKMESIKKGAVKDYWDKVKAATQYSVDSDYKNGIISKELHGHVSNMFNWYVPLRKYDEATAEDTYGYITEKGDPKSYIGSTIMRARGHKYLSETNILAQIGAMGNRAISNGGQNAIKQAFARFARSHSGNNLITETSVWYETDPKTGIVYERYPDIPDDATPDEINQIVSDFNKDMKSKASQGLASKVYRRGSIGYKFQRAENRSQHIVDVMIAGKKHSFVINGNPRAAQALNGLLEHKVGTFGKPFSVISRYMAQTCTSYNPEFVMRNMIRDFEFASTNLLAKEGMAYTKTFEKYYAQVGLIEGIRNTKLSDLKKMTGFGLFSKYRNGTLDTSDKIQRYFKEFMENGGETGWVQVKNTKELTAEYKLHIKTERNKVRKVSKGIFDAVFKNLENINEVAENLARFATYCASRDAGRSTVRSAYDAKEVSTNFNRHGSGSEIKSFKNGEMSGFDNAKKQTYRFTSAWFRNTSMFFNAGIQSTNLLIKNFKNNKAGTLGYIMAGPMISGMAMALLNNFLIANEDEKERNGVKDPYGELPDYIRRNNLCIYTGGGEFITIPLAIEERAFYGLGDLAAGLTFSKNISSQKMPNLTENKDIDKYLNPVMDAVGCISQLVPVADYLGNASFGKHPVQETAKAVLPSATSPFLEWAFNSDWKGAPIHRENKFDEYQPSWMLAYQGTPEWLINMNKKVNAMTNDVAPGNENMLGNGFLDAVTDPAGLQHFYSGYLGGAATFMERLGGIVKNGKDTETKDIPFVRSLFYTPSEKTSLQRTKSKWYNYLDETEKMIANAKRLKSKNVPLDELVKNYGDYYKFKQSKGAEKMNVIETATKEMKNWKKLRDKSNDTESIKFANQNIDNIMMRAVNELDKLN